MQAANDRSIFLSTLPATGRDRAIALAVVCISSALFACTVPFAGAPLAPVPAFVASNQSALAISDVITAVLLFSQFGILRSRALLLLASGYLFTAAAAIVHALTFPGLFAPAGLLNAGPQTTVWLYMIWHGGFPLLVLGYALLKDRDGGAPIRGSVGAAILASALAVGIAISALTWLVTSRHDILPTLLSEGHYTSTMIGVVSAVWSLSLAALLVLWLRRRHSVLDIWLMVVMCAWLFDIALSAIVNVAPFDLGFYVGRIYGLGAATFVLAVCSSTTSACRPSCPVCSAGCTGRPPPNQDNDTDPSTNDGELVSVRVGVVLVKDHTPRNEVPIFQAPASWPVGRRPPAGRIPGGRVRLEAHGRRASGRVDGARLTTELGRWADDRHATAPVPQRRVDALVPRRRRRGPRRDRAPRALDGGGDVRPRSRRRWRRRGAWWPSTSAGTATPTTRRARAATRAPAPTSATWTRCSGTWRSQTRSSSATPWAA